MPHADAFFRTMQRFFKDYWSALGRGGAVGQLMQKVSRDPALHERFLKTPLDVLKKNNIKLPQGMKVEVYANTDKVFHLILPPMIENDEPREAKK